MRIHFTSQDRPKAIARKLRGLLKDAGSPVTQSRALEIVAGLYGYPTWQELSSSIGTQKASPDDHDVPEEIVTIRREAQVQALCRHGLTPSQASEAVLKLRPTGGIEREFPVVEDIGFIGSRDALTQGIRLTEDFDRGLGLTDRILNLAFTERASDIYIVPCPTGYEVIFRKDGQRSIVHTGAASELAPVLDLMRDRAGMDLGRRHVAQEGLFKIQHGGTIFVLRVASVPVSGSEQLIVRVIDLDRVPATLEQLMFGRAPTWRDTINASHGLCLIVEDGDADDILGATVRDLERLGKKIYRSDDPVEYRIPYIGTVDLHTRIDFSQFGPVFRGGDTMVIGEIRSEDEVHALLGAASTGHMVIATMRAGSLAEAVNRLRSLGAPDAELRKVLRGVLVNRRQVSDQDLVAALSSGASKAFPTDLVNLMVDTCLVLEGRTVIVQRYPTGQIMAGFANALFEITEAEHESLLQAFVAVRGVSEMTRLSAGEINRDGILHSVRVQWYSDLQAFAFRCMVQQAQEANLTHGKHSASLLDRLHKRGASPEMLAILDNFAKAA